MWRRTRLEPPYDQIWEHVIMSITLKDAPIFMIGAERSGTTLVMAMLGCHPRIAVPEVVWWYPRFRPYLHTFGDLSKEDNFRTLADEMIFGLKTPFWGMKVNARTIVDEILADLKERSFAGIFAAMHERYARINGNKPRWGEKTPHNLYFVKEILEDFPNAQFIFITRDGRDASADYLESAFGPTNIFAAAESWKSCQNAVVPWRKKLNKKQWFDLNYEELVRDPEKVLRATCQFLGEDYSDAMLEFHQTDIAKSRGATKDHAPLGHAASDQYIGIYKNLLSLRDQAIFAAVAGKELAEAGYKSDVPPAKLSEHQMALYRELDGRFRAAGLTAPEGHIVYESYNDWVIDQREERRRRGLWDAAKAPKNYPIGEPDEEIIIGQRAHRKWKDHLCVKRQYAGRAAL
jgi:Sulfotransferase family